MQRFLITARSCERYSFAMLWIAAISLVAMLAPEPAAGAPADTGQPFPHVRVDRAARTVEFDGEVPIDARTPDSKGRHPLIYLEQIACTPDTREHESLVVTPARPSHIHAALLLIGLEPGAPGAWAQQDGTLVFSPPTGDGIRIEFVTVGDDGDERVEPALSWVRHARTGARPPNRVFVFAGSRVMDRPRAGTYDADMSGTLIGLATFGTETIAFPEDISPEQSVQEPVWIADPERTPPRGTLVRVRLSPAP